MSILLEKLTYTVATSFYVAVIFISV